MSQAIATTTTQPVTVVCNSASTTTRTVTMAPTYVRLLAASGQHGVILQQPLILGYNRR